MGKIVEGGRGNVNLFFHLPPNVCYGVPSAQSPRKYQHYVTVDRQRALHSTGWRRPIKCLNMQFHIYYNSDVSQFHQSPHAISLFVMISLIFGGFSLYFRGFSEIGRLQTSNSKVGRPLIVKFQIGRLGRPISRKKGEKWVTVTNNPWGLWSDPCGARRLRG